MRKTFPIADASSHAQVEPPKALQCDQVGALPASCGLASNRPHILFLIDMLCKTTGPGRSLLLMIPALQKKGFRCTLATFKTYPPEDTFEDFPCPWHLFKLRRTYDWNALRIALSLRRLIRSERVQVVHTFFETSDLWGGLVAKLCGCPVLISSRRDMGIMRSAKHQLAYPLVNRLFDRVLAVSEEVRSFCIQHDGLPPQKVVTLYNAVDTKEITAAECGRELRTTLRLSGTSPLIITVAHLRKVKGVDVLVRTAARVCREFADVTFLVVGETVEPQYGRELQALIRALGLTDRVRLLGSRKDIFSLLKKSNIFCMLSRSEGFSNALIEAMACGLPCVVTRVGGNGEAVQEGRSGFLVDSEDVETAARQILTLLRNPDRARQMGLVGQQIVQTKFTVEAQTERLVSLYESLLEGKRS